MNDSKELAEISPVSTSVLSLIARAASDPAVDVAKMQALLDMQERLMAREAEQDFNRAYARLQLKLPRVTKKGEVQYPINKNQPEGPMRKAFNYARYEDIDELVRPILNDEGFSLSYNTEPQVNGTILIIGALLHVGGHQKLARIGPLPLDTSGGKNNLQAATSTFSYGKRYCMTMLLNLVFEGEDDDGVRGGIIFIDAAGIAEIEALIAETKADRLKFLEFMGVADLENLQEHDKARAINALMMKRRRRPAQSPASEPPAQERQQEPEAALPLSAPRAAARAPGGWSLWRQQFDTAMRQCQGKNDLAALIASHFDDIADYNHALPRAAGIFADERNRRMKELPDG